MGSGKHDTDITLACVVGNTSSVSYISGAVSYKIETEISTLRAQRVYKNLTISGRFAYLVALMVVPLGWPC